jgi:hypothetical protein
MLHITKDKKANKRSFTYENRILLYGFILHLRALF